MKYIYVEIRVTVIEVVFFFFFLAVLGCYQKK